MTGDMFTIICLGDVVGRPGRALVQRSLLDLKNQYGADLAVVNAENASGGLGLSAKNAEELLRAGVDIMTLGDHVWDKKELRSWLDSNTDRCIRPANYPEGEGRGWTVVEKNGLKVGIFTVLGRVYTGALVDCPFKAADTILSENLSDCQLIVCDIHAEATSEKVAMGYYLDGRASLVFGTHTHVQTADETVLENGTAYITDLGMCGSSTGVIGMDREVALQRFLQGRVSGYEISKGSPVLNGVVARFSTDTGRAVSIERFSFGE